MTDLIIKTVGVLLSQLIGFVILIATTAAALATDVIAHRGNACGLIENSQQAVTTAWAVNVDAIELDVRLSVDGIVYLFHDDEIEGLAVSAMTHKSLKQLVGDQAVPTLASILAIESDAGYYLLDLKQWSVSTVMRLIEVVRLAGISHQKIVFQSESMGVLKTIQQKLPAAQYYFLSRIKRRLPLFRPPSADHLARRLVQYELDGVSLKGRRFIDREYIDAFRKRGINVNVWTVNTPKRADFYRSIDVDGLITDNPISMMSKYGQAMQDEHACSSHL